MPDSASPCSECSELRDLFADEALHLAVQDSELPHAGLPTVAATTAADPDEGRPLGFTARTVAGDMDDLWPPEHTDWVEDFFAPLWIEDLGDSSDMIVDGTL